MKSQITHLSLLLILTNSLMAWSPGVTSPAPLTDLTVDTSQRNDVISFYQNVYKASQNYASAIQWSGHVEGCQEGSLTTTFTDLMRRRINYFRALAGVPASIVMNDNSTVVTSGDSYGAPASTLKSAAAQKAALMLTRNNFLTHNPPTTATCFSSEAGNGCFFGNVAIGLYGPPALDAYMREDFFNQQAGHRRWILFTSATNFATGDIPASGNYAAANNLYISQRSEELAETSPVFIAWPPAGFCPWKHSTEYFSLSYPMGDFSNATISVSRNGVTQTIDSINRSQGYGNSGIVWRVPSVYTDHDQNDDVTYDVTVANIGGGGPTSHSYSIHFMNADYLPTPPTLNGLNIVPPGGSRNYVIGPVDIAEEYRLEVGKKSSLPATTVEGAEDATTAFVTPGPVTGPGYNVRSTTYKLKGLKSLNLAFTDVSQLEQWVEINRVLLPKEAASMSYYRRLSYMTSDTTFAAQYCINDDGRWKDIPGTAIAGTSPASASSIETETAFTPKLTYALPSETLNQPTKIRLLIRKSSTQGFITNTIDKSGAFIDEISFSNVDWLSKRTITSLPANTTVAPLNSTTAGEALVTGAQYTVRLQPRVGSNWMTASSIINAAVSSNMAPTLDAISGPLNIAEDADVPSVALSGISAGPDEIQNLIVTATSSNATLIPNPTVVYTSPNTTGLLNLKPAAHQSGTAIITVTVNDGQATNNTAVRQFVVNVAAVNDAPTISAIADRAINESASVSVPFTIGDVDHPLASLQLSASSSDTELVPVTGLILSGTTASRKLTVRPALKRFGTCTIQVSATDGQETVQRIFQLTVNNLNDIPTLDPIANLVINEDDPTQTISLTGISAGPFEDQPLTLTAVSNKPLIVPNPTIDYASPGNTATLTFTPLPNASGVATITVRVNDGQASKSDLFKTFRVTVTPINDKPTMTQIEDVTVNEDTPSAPLPFQISDVETLPARLKLSIASTNLALLPVSRISFGGTGNNRTVIINPVLHQSGTAQVTVTVSDGGLTDTSTFNVTVNPVNDAPTLTVIKSPLNINEDAPEQILNLAGVTTGAVNETQTLSISATSSNTDIIAHPVVTYQSPQAIAQLRYRPQMNAFGTAIITVTVDDGDQTNNSFSRSFTVNVKPINDLPTLTPIPVQAVVKNGATEALPFSVSDIETDASALLIRATSSNTTLIPNANLVLAGEGGNRSITITPAPNKLGTATISVTAGDGAATAKMTFVLNVVETLPQPLAMMTQAQSSANFEDLSFEDWIALQYPQLTGSAFSDDYDKDGMANGVEYAFDLNPTQADSSGELQIDHVTRAMRLVTPLPTQRNQINYSVEFSNNLEWWSTEGTSVIHADGLLRGTCPLGEKARYIRWKIERN